MDTASIVLREADLLSSATGRVALTVFALDISSSMAPHGDVPRAELNRIIEETAKLEGAENVFYTVLSFCERVELCLPLTTFAHPKLVALYHLGHSTALYQASHNAISIGLEFLGMAREKGYESRVDVMVLSDGENTTLEEFCVPARARAAFARAQGIGLHVTGIGTLGERLAQVLAYDPALAKTVQGTRAGVTDAMRSARTTTEHSVAFTTQIGSPRGSSATRVGDVLDANGNTILQGRDGRKRP